MREAWYNLTEKDLPGSTTFQALCQIVQAPLWTNLPKISNGQVQRKYGWDRANSVISILDPFALRVHKPWLDPPDFATLFQKEADAHEREIAAAATIAYRKGDLVEAYRLRSLAEKFLLDRTIKWVRLIDTQTFSEPDASTRGVLIHPRISRRIETGVDRGSLILLPEAPPTSQVELSVISMLKGF
jgi:hypothetical protein